MCQSHEQPRPAHEKSRLEHQNPGQFFVASIENVPKNLLYQMPFTDFILVISIGHGDAFC
jgi:hypothetical protein